MYNRARQYKDFSSKWFVFGNLLPFPETTIQKRKNDYCDKTLSKKKESEYMILDIAVHHY